MSNPNDHDIKVLNGLIETTLDSADGYREAASNTDDAGYQSLFDRHAVERQGVAEGLKEHVRALGGDPESDGSILAKAHRAFLDVKHALVRNDNTIAGSIETGETHLRTRYEQALEDGKISATTREAVRRAYALVAAGADEARSLKARLDSRRDADSALYPQ